MYDIIGYPFGWLMWLLYQIAHNYMFDLILFTVITKLLLLPITIKQQKNTARMSLFQPKLQELKKKYGNNQQKYQEEMQKLYEREGVNPASSCLPMFIQMFLLFGIYDVVNKPLTHILRMSKDGVNSFIEIAKNLGCEIGKGSLQSQLNALNFFKQNPDAFKGYLDSNTFDALNNFKIEFFGINFGQIPTWGWNLIILIPILSGVTALLSGFISQQINKKNNPAMQGQGATMGMMLLFAPIMSFWIAFRVPAGVGFYWIISNIFIIIQTIVISKIYTPEKLKEIAEKEMEKIKEKRKVTVDTNIVDEETGEVKTVVKELSDAEKIAAARKKMAEKYGED